MTMQHSHTLYVEMHNPLPCIHHDFKPMETAEKNLSPLLARPMNVAVSPAIYKNGRAVLQIKTFIQ